MSEDTKPPNDSGSVVSQGYASSLLRCHDLDDDDCPVCRFLSGDKSQVVLLAVIARIDGKLARVESMRDKLVEILHGQIDKINQKVRT